MPIALLRDKTLVEFHEDTGGGKFAGGDIYLGNVKKVVQGLNATFIDIGYEKDAFPALPRSRSSIVRSKFNKLVRAKRSPVAVSINSMPKRTSTSMEKSANSSLKPVHPCSGCREPVNQRPASFFGVVTRRTIPGIGTVRQFSQCIEAH